MAISCTFLVISCIFLVISCIFLVISCIFSSNIVHISRNKRTRVIGAVGNNDHLRWPRKEGRAHLLQYRAHLLQYRAHSANAVLGGGYWLPIGCWCRWWWFPIGCCCFVHFVHFQLHFVHFQRKLHHHRRFSCMRAIDNNNNETVKVYFVCTNENIFIHSCGWARHIGNSNGSVATYESLVRAMTSWLEIQRYFLFAFAHTTHKCTHTSIITNICNVCICRVCIRPFDIYMTYYETHT